MKYASDADFTDNSEKVLPAARPLATTPVMGLPLVCETTADVVPALLSPGQRCVYFMNAHCFNVRARCPTYKRALNRADVLLPDGIGVEIAAKLGGASIPENLNGTDLTPGLMTAAAQKGLSVFLLGGRSGTAQRAAQKLCTHTPGLQIAGTCNGYDDLHNTEALIDRINASGADIVLVAMGVPLQELWIDKHAHRLNARLIMAVGGLFDFLAGNVRRAPVPVRRARLEWVWRLAMEPRRLARRYLIGNFNFLARATHHALSQASANASAKRTLDIGVAGVALALLGPALLLTALLIRFDSKGPALFYQTRVGLNGKPFRILKFRSMHLDAEARRAALLNTSNRDGLCFKAHDDPRITRIGRWIRRFSIDELPQILNVLKGDMSIVGPRPALPEETAQYPLRALQRQQVKPGITGIWQVSGRADIGFEKMVDMDIAYVRAHSIILDILLIGLTFRALISGRGAY